jgi:hypothetical protein
MKIITFNQLKSLLNESLSKKDIKRLKKLYHATYRPLLKKIKQSGFLGGKNLKRNYTDSKPGITYWASDPDIAYSYAEESETVKDEWLDDIIVFECDIKNFDLNKLFYDRNVLLDDDEIPETFEYHDVMPFEKLRIIDV